MGYHKESIHDHSFEFEEITAAYDTWYPIIKEIFTCCEESEVR
jgi:hypothetical protein